MKLTLLILGSVLTLVSFLALLRTPLWWVRVFDFPRAHVALFLTATFLAYIGFYRQGGTQETILLIVWLIAIFNEVRYIYSFTPLASKEALSTEETPPSKCFSIMIANVRMTNKKHNKFLQLVLKNNPDILIINEPNEAWHQSLKPELDKRFPFAIKKPLENTYGMILYSKFKLSNSEVRFLVEDGIPSFYTEVELPYQTKFDLYTVHPQPPRLMQNTETREAELLLVAKMVKETQRPSIVAGDLNDVAWSHTTKLFKQISGLLDPRVGRGFFNTYNAFIPFFRYPLDHVFYDHDFRLVDLKKLPEFGSDHFPILITLNYEPQEKEEQEKPVADQDDKKEANELIQEGLEKGDELNHKKRQSGQV
ncbi:endonuclease/exonuclease/phosphatase family protein [Botryobacter ruber]|uniref:endonuclease/exonuclease/phosphatase family protein n=1 Tax=Botryobacter ruber TaxID=2171629 RepID=UPI000E0C5C3B|nr:endonuclease/exonuclease/phosphatase family protein [Botryobacter ruber]